MEPCLQALRPGSGSDSFRNLPGRESGRHAQDGMKPVVFCVERIEEE